MNFIPNTHYVYYKIYNKDKNITYYGLIDIKENKVLYNIEGDDITFIPDSSGQMIAITQTELYKICIIKDNDECNNIDQCPHIMLDPEGNKCQSNCDEGKIEMIPEGICLNKHECNLNIYIFNEGETKCGLCKNINSNDAIYKLINVQGCLNEIPNNAEYYNENQKLLKCKTNYHLENNQCLPVLCYERCETCSEVSANINSQKCLSCKNGYILDDNNNCLNLPTTIPNIITTNIYSNNNSYLNT